MAMINPISIPGRWREGFALDYHTLSSEFLGYDEFGNAQFDTKRSEVGELLYQLKYKRNPDALERLIQIASEFIKKRFSRVDVIVPVPPTRVRRPQPVFEVATGIGKSLGIPVIVDFVRNVKNIKELKNVYDYSERIKLLEGAHKVHDQSLSGKVVLLFDDLYRSGATLNAVTQVLYDQGKCSVVYVLTLTKTRIAS
jgi:predicted amidophosphoribosyltransferase